MRYSGSVTNGNLIIILQERREVVSKEKEELRARIENLIKQHPETLGDTGLDLRFIGAREKFLIPVAYAKLMFFRLFKVMKAKNAPLCAKVVSSVMAILTACVILFALSLPLLFPCSILLAIGGEWIPLVILIISFILFGILVYWMMSKDVGLLFDSNNYYLAVRSKGGGVWLVNSFVALKMSKGIMSELARIMNQILLPALKKEGITLEIEAGNADLAKMYEKCGFRRVNELEMKCYLRKVKMTTAPKEEASSIRKDG